MVIAGERTYLRLEDEMDFFFKLIFGCAGSSLLREGFLCLWQVGAYSLVAVLGILIAVASPVGQHRL